MAAVFSHSNVVTVAREWIGTSYRHGHATKGRGCDCVGLVRGVMAELTGEPLVSVPPYSPSWRVRDGGNVLETKLAEHMESIDPADVIPGDVLTFRMFGHEDARHCAILATETTLIHTYQGIAAVEEVAFVRRWRERAGTPYRFREIT